MKVITLLIGLAMVLTASATPIDVRKYNLHAQCARFAALSGYEKLSAVHLRVALVFRPERIKEGDLQYRYGYADGATAYMALTTRVSVKEAARDIFRKGCPWVA